MSRVPEKTVAARALLPLRFFFGATFLYAGFDKLVDPRFLDPASPASIQAQMVAFTRVSPLAPLVRLGQPFAVEIGVAIAVAEIAIGIGALTGLAFRAAAVGGAALSILFFLTASWATRPFYYGPDLPYAAGWITLALAGHGGVLVADRLIVWASGRPPASATARGRGGRRAAREAAAAAAAASPLDAPLRDRRTVLQAGVLGVLALVAASLAIPFRSGALETTTEPDASGAGAGSGSASEAAGGASGSPAAGASVSAPPAGGLVVAHVADLGKTGARAFTVPFTAPAPLPAGDPAVIVKLADGSFVAFDAVCTHAGCTVEWDQADRLLICPCHDAVFDPAADAAVLAGPARQPLAPIPIRVDQASGAISLGA